MSRFANIAHLAEQLVAEALATPKTASATVSHKPAHPVAVLLKQAAATLRETLDIDDVSLEAVQKFAAALQPGTGAQSPNTGAGVGANPSAPTLPSLRTTNLGVTAGSGGAPPSMKIASELRRMASELRVSETDTPAQTESKVAHILNAARGLHYLREGFHQ